MASGSDEVIVRDLWDRDHPSDMDHTVKLPTVFEPSPTGLSTEQRDTYKTIIDDIIAEKGGGVISGEYVLRLLRERASLESTRQRHLLKMLIIQRLKRLPTPRTVTTTYTGRGYMALRVTKTASAIFDVPELLESILTHVNMADLIAARRVNKAVFRLVETSPKLQRKLFLLPGKGPSGYLGWVCDGSPTRFFAPSGRRSSGVMLGSYDMIAAEDPFLGTDLTDVWDRPTSPDGKDLLGPLASPVPARMKAQIFDSEVWPEMYLTSPPCTGVTIHIEYTEEYEGRHTIRFNIFRAVYDPAGVTFATLWDVLHKKGELRVWKGYKSLSEECYDDEQVANTTVCEQIDLHRRRGIEVTLNRERSNIDFYSVAVLAHDIESEAIKRDDNNGWGRAQAVEWE